MSNNLCLSVALHVWACLVDTRVNAGSNDVLCVQDLEEFEVLQETQVGDFRTSAGNTETARIFQKNWLLDS